MEVNVLVLDVAGKLTKWRNYFVTSLKLLLLFQPGEELFPKDENGKVIYDSVDFCRTWEVSPGRKPGEEPGDWEPPFFLPPVRMGCGLSDSAVHESKDWDVGVVGRKPLLKCSQSGMKEKNMGQCRQASISFHVICLLQGFLRRRWLILLLVSWPSSPFFFLKINVNS